VASARVASWTAKAADAAGRADDQDRVAVGQFERIDSHDRGDAGEWRGAGGGEVDTSRSLADEHVLRDGDQLGPASVMDGRVGVEEEAEDLVAHAVAGDLGAGLLDDAGVVASEDDGELVLEPICLSIPVAIELSAGLAEEACTRTSTSFGAGVGAGRSSRRPGGVSNAVMTTASTCLRPPCLSVG
jgi:hypothetical protein